MFQASILKLILLDLRNAFLQRLADMRIRARVAHLSIEFASSFEVRNV